MKPLVLSLILAVACISSLANAKSRATGQNGQSLSNVYVSATGVPSARVAVLQAAIEAFAPGKTIQCFDLGGSEERCGSGYDHASFQEDGIECETSNLRAGVFYDCSRSVAGEPLYRVQLRKDGRVKYNNFWAPSSDRRERFR